MNPHFMSVWMRDAKYPFTAKQISSSIAILDNTSTSSPGSTTAPAGFFQTLGILIITLAISEVICLLLLQVVSRITWHSFYSEFSSFPLFLLEVAPVEEGVREQIPTIEKERLDDILITSTWRGNQTGNNSNDNSNINIKSNIHRNNNSDDNNSNNNSNDNNSKHETTIHYHQHSFAAETSINSKQCAICLCDYGKFFTT